ncbi:MAG TPA: ATP-binding protein [Gemmatimonadaceae bacterium]
MPAAADRERPLLLTTGMALARAITVDRALHEAGHQLLHTLSCDGVAIALLDEEGGSPRLVHQVGFDGEPPAAAPPATLAADWEGVIASGTTTSRSLPGAVQLTVPVSANGAARGALTVVTPADRDPARGMELERLVSGVGAQLAVALDRAALLARLEHRRRVTTAGEVAAGIAHELRNPLFGISSAAQLLRFRVQEDPVIEKNVGRILREVERLNTLTSALLEFGRPAPLRKAPVDPDAVWDDVLGLQRGRLESRALRVGRERASPPARVDGDAEQLAQLFTQLLVNAIDAAPEGTDLSLVTTRLPDGSWRGRLANGGSPIAPDALPRVFDLFFSTKAGATGIGLPIAQRIAEAHGGTLSLESSGLGGTTAVVILPAQAG